MLSSLKLFKLPIKYLTPFSCSSIFGSYGEARDATVRWPHFSVFGPHSWFLEGLQGNSGFCSSSCCSFRVFSSFAVDKGDQKCWSCGASAASFPFLSCDSCRSVQPLDPSINYFDIFGLKKGYDIRDHNLENKYKEWQKKLHPDLVHSKSEREKNYAAEQSLRVIEAYHTLSRPLSRAIYLVRLEGVDFDEEKTISDPDFLVEIMEIRESVEEAVDKEALKQIESEIRVKLGKAQNSYEKAFENRDFEDALTLIRRMTYYERAIEEIEKKL
ncbi:hypothetical protein AMTRI_Chr03g149560 [Amborella trichopoda]|uniref:J domain-containing protein n=1 Tax=Amborella trichopoda TaxID=13333 RepID=W1NDK0_AMBTC|nr:iron-sulfur cluster co-chaperone protein HscB, mitochondrial [Amborella trichopoda]XP_011627625.1 iron-sulfur cluster co-chaperone protein HscB, mitochondrial [Amborella trichopoda]ERM93662.1 hypothetical protein AMTR_s00004p00162550 [Amborella trichopoda]|eukprot:XP_006826425.1 iron-sulfur cluster co-chaperone protein HscB, mitochondrial [Amborella trichopoda]